MARKVFFSFHFDNDFWRTNQVRNIGVIEGKEPISSNDWEEVKRKGEESIKTWIEENLEYKTCCIVLVGAETAQRKWVKYEINRAWDKGKGVVGICIHKLEDQNGKQSTKGANPFDLISLSDEKLSKIVKLYDPPYQTSKYVYDNIAENIADWVEEAISIRSKYK